MTEKDLGITTVETHERLHVDIGSSCNNNCIFCMEEDRTGRRDKVGAITPEDVRRVLEANVFRKELVFVSGEPTLNPQFLQFVKWARELGYTSIGVISNGRIFSYQPFAAKAVRLGLNQVILSIHGATPRIHNGLVRTPNAFEQVHQGLVNLAALKRQGFRLRLHTSTVLNKRNATQEELDRILELLRPLVDQMVFNIMQPFGRGLTHFDRLMLKYSEMATILGEFFTRHQGEHLPIYLVDIPYCVTEGVGIPDSSRGFVERYVHYDKDETSLARGEGGSPMKQELRSAEESVEVEGLVEKHRDDQEASKKLRRPQCNTCRYSRVCDGVWTNYIERNGWDEFEPVG